MHVRFTILQWKVDIILIFSFSSLRPRVIKNSFYYSFDFLAKSQRSLWCYRYRSSDEGRDMHWFSRFSFSTHVECLWFRLIGFEWNSPSMILVRHSSPISYHASDFITFLAFLNALAMPTYSYKPVFRLRHWLALGDMPAMIDDVNMLVRRITPKVIILRRFLAWSLLTGLKSYSPLSFQPASRMYAARRVSASAAGQYVDDCWLAWCRCWYEDINSKITFAIFLQRDIYSFSIELLPADFQACHATARFQPHHFSRDGRDDYFSRYHLSGDDAAFSLT